MTDILEKGGNTVPETNETVEKITTENTDAKSKESIYNSRQDVISRLIIVVDQPIEEAKDEVEYLKQVYYKIRKTEIEKEKAEYLDTNGDMTGYEVSQDEYEEQFKDLLNKFKEKKATYQLEREKEKECNYARKKDILEELKTIVADTDNINKHYNEFVDLSKKFK